MYVSLCAGGADDPLKAVTDDRRSKGKRWRRSSRMRSDQTPWL